MERLKLPYDELRRQWCDKGLKPPAGLSATLLEKQTLLQSVHLAHPDTPCRSCGNCCPTFPFTVRYVEYRCVMEHVEKTFTIDEKRGLIEERAGRVRQGGHPVCPFLGEGKCLVYPARPLVCRRAVAGESICLRYDQSEKSCLAWAGGEESFRFLALSCLVNYIEEDGAYREIGLAVPGRGTLSMAPFEFWFLLELGRVELVSQLLETSGYHPQLRWAGK